VSEFNSRCWYNENISLRYKWTNTNVGGKMLLKQCPWCKNIPTYKKYNAWWNYDHTGKSYDNIISLPTESIECVNVHCKVRPNITRINTNDAIDIWNNWDNKFN
jgi:hypothetical protein